MKTAAITATVPIRAQAELPTPVRPQAALLILEQPEAALPTPVRLQAAALTRRRRAQLLQPETAAITATIGPGQTAERLPAITITEAETIAGAEAAGAADVSQSSSL